jgi:hypothetical protein
MSSDESLFNRISQEDILRLFGLTEDELLPSFRENLSEVDTRWRPPTQEELEAHVLDVLTRIDGRDAARTADENLQAFERGWRENLEEALRTGLDSGALRPRYFPYTKYSLYGGALIISQDRDLPYKLFHLCRTIIFWKYLRGFDKIYEFGCGSCNNLLELSRMFPNARLVGLDWAQSSVDIAALLADQGGLKVEGMLFDFLNPPQGFVLEPGSAVLTVHALEQLGERFSPWIEFLLQAKPAIVVNYEPVVEFYDHGKLWDYLAFCYSRKRNYLSGYWPALQRLADQGRVEILAARRPYLAGVIHEASLIVWRPL